MTPFLFGFGTQSIGQTMPECDANVPTFVLDLTSHPNQTFTTPEFVRQATCCSDGDRYVAFYVMLHPDVAMFELEVAPGYADPIGSGNYQIITGGDLNTPGICGPQIPAGDPICITGVGPQKILYSKPGGNNVSYIFKQIPKPVFPADDTTRVGCSLPFNIYGLDNIVVTSINSSTGVTTAGFYDNLLDMTNPAAPIFSPGYTTPEWIDYQICGSPLAEACGTYQSCDTVRLYTRNELSISVTPNPASFCIGDSVQLNAFAVGGDENYTFNWYDSGLNLIGSEDSIYIGTQGSYTAEVMDGLVSPTCPAERITVPVSIGLPPVVNAGPDQTVCAEDPTVLLMGTVTNAPGGTWYGGAGVYSVTVVDAFGCEVSLNTVINQPDSLFVELISPQQLSGYNISAAGGSDGSIQSMVYGGVEEYTYVWSTGSTASDIYYLTAGTYSVIVTDANGCTAKNMLTLIEPRPLAMPEGLSPNGDMQNDFFVIKGIEAYPDNELIIYNRWGNIVYQRSGYNNEWQGENMKGEELPDGTYFAIFKPVVGGNAEPLTGYVDLRRKR